MGYRSDVAIVMKEKDFLTMLEEVKQAEIKWLNDWILSAYNHPEVKNKPFCELNPQADDYQWVALYWEWVKWYEDYQEVAFIENFLQKINQYDFVRIGEDDDDTEIIYKSQNYLIGVERRITFDV